jgi:two-component system nitrogen regulation sensor histidine kinase NtrY
VTKRTKGTGLGLAIVKKVMEDHKGWLALEDAPPIDETDAPRESGALVRLTFPRRAGATQPQVTGNEQERRIIGA